MLLRLRLLIWQLRSERGVTLGLRELNYRALQHLRIFLNASLGYARFGYIKSDPTE